MKDLFRKEKKGKKRRKMNSTNQTNSTWTLNDIISFHYLPYIIMNSVGIIVGVSGNLLIMSAILLTKQLQNKANILIFNLSLAHFFVASFVDSTALIGINIFYFKIYNLQNIKNYILLI